MTIDLSRCFDGTSTPSTTPFANRSFSIHLLALSACLHFQAVRKLYAVGNGVPVVIVNILYPWIQRFANPEFRYLVGLKRAEQCGKDIWSSKHRFWHHSFGQSISTSFTVLE